MEDVESLPLGGQFPASLIELLAKVDVLLFQLVDKLPGRGRHGVQVASGMASASSDKRADKATAPSVMPEAVAG